MFPAVFFPLSHTSASLKLPEHERIRDAFYGLEYVFEYSSSQISTVAHHFKRAKGKRSMAQLDGQTLWTRKRAEKGSDLPSKMDALSELSIMKGKTIYHFPHQAVRSIFEPAIGAEITSKPARWVDRQTGKIWLRLVAGDGDGAYSVIFSLDPFSKLITRTIYFGENYGIFGERRKFRATVLRSQR